MKGLALVVAASLCIAAFSLIVYAISNEPAALIGVGVAGVVILAVFLDFLVRVITPPGEQISI